MRFVEIIKPITKIFDDTVMKIVGLLNLAYKLRYINKYINNILNKEIICEAQNVNCILYSSQQPSLLRKF